MCSGSVRTANVLSLNSRSSLFINLPFLYTMITATAKVKIQWKYCRRCHHMLSKATGTDMAPSKQRLHSTATANPNLIISLLHLAYAVLYKYYLLCEEMKKIVLVVCRLVSSPSPLFAVVIFYRLYNIFKLTKLPILA